MCGTQALATLFRMDIGPGYVSRRGGRVATRCARGIGWSDVSDRYMTERGCPDHVAARTTADRATRPGQTRA